MSVVLSESALRFFLEEENGPVGRDLRRRAEQVTALASANASGQVIGILSGALHSGIRYEIGADAEGLFAVVKTGALSRWRGRPFSYPSYHDQVTGRPWLTGALRDGFDA